MRGIPPEIYPFRRFAATLLLSGAAFGRQETRSASPERGRWLSTVKPEGVLQHSELYKARGGRREQGMNFGITADVQEIYES